MKVKKETGRYDNGVVIPHERDEVIAERIKDWIALGAQVEDIAVYLNLRPGVVKKCYAKELAIGKFANDMEVGKTILDMAKSGESAQMTIFYAKSRMGWRDTDKNDQNNQAPLNITIHT